MKNFRATALLAALTASLTFFAGHSAHAAQVHVAVASNFTGALKSLSDAFKKETGHEIIASSGSTAKLYTQITQGAPFEVFLAADREHPQRLESKNHGVPGTRFSYASGKLVLWSAEKNLIDSDGKVLREGRFAKLALANPRVAPYGAAAKQVLEAQKLWDTVQAKLVFSENIAQTQQFIASGNAQLGFIALAQVQQHDFVYEGSRWVVPRTLYAPLVQDAILLPRGAANPAAKAFLEFLKTPAARSIIEQNGYDLP